MFLPEQPKLLKTCVSGSLPPGLAVGLVSVKPAACASVQAAKARPETTAAVARDMAAPLRKAGPLLCNSRRGDSSEGMLHRQLLIRALMRFLPPDDRPPTRWSCRRPACAAAAPRPCSARRHADSACGKRSRGAGS